MLTNEQEFTLRNACELFMDARKAKENKAESLGLYNKAFGMLADYIDEVDDIYYRLVFANCIEEMQRKFGMDFEDIFIQAKVDIYIEVLQLFLDTQQFNKNFQGHLSIAFDALARLFLLGEENVKQSDHNARICYLCINAIGLPMLADLYLQDFVQNEATGEWMFTGVRPL